MNFIGTIFFFDGTNHAAWMVLGHKRHNTFSNLTGRRFSSIAAY
ncbi:hypothetical protein [Chryseobacterium oncorhynchi]|nr:hypothetical protein [Chryseobacterium oncorhynchi]